MAKRSEQLVLFLSHYLNTMQKSTWWKLIGMTAIGSLALAGGSVSAKLLYDCSLVAVSDHGILQSAAIGWTVPLNQDDMKDALTDLKAYCCQQGEITERCEGVKQSTTNPQSPYMFHQLVSRWFFKLDNKIDGSKDSKADEWKTKLKEWEESGKGNAPVTIQNTFVQTRQPSKRYQPRLIEQTCEIANYNQLDMAARYTAVCMQSACITRKFFVTTSDLDSRYDQTACEAMARRRIETEMTYIQTLMVKKTNTLVWDTWNAYTKNYLVETRRWTLIDKFSRINESFSTVNGKVQEGTRMCSVG